ncbi:MAG: hypothetical protein LBC58_03630 [Clostridiales Family XIII bacterium]|jgi:hypothetical protein|nr:hypothetical protein [Clostridiales Family XIII bacterium]
MEEKITMPEGISDELKAYIDRIVEQKVRETLAAKAAELDTPPDGPAPVIIRADSLSICPGLSTPELDDLWVTAYFTPEASAPPAQRAALAGIRPAESISPYAAPDITADTGKPRFSLKKKISFLVIGVIAFALCVQILSANGIIDFQNYSDLTAKLFGNIF